MDGLTKRVEATHIYDCEGAQNAIAADVNAIDPDLIMAVAQRKSNANCDYESDGEAEDVADVVSEDTRIKEKKEEDNVKKAERERKLGRKAYKKEDYEKAVNHFEKAINLNSRKIAYHFRLAEAKLEQKKYKQCLEICSDAIKVGKENKGSVSIKET